MKGERLFITKRLDLHHRVRIAGRRSAKQTPATEKLQGRASGRESLKISREQSCEKLFCETGLLKDRNFKHISQHWVLMKLRPMRPVLFSNYLPSTKHLDSGRAHTTAR